MSRAAGNVGHLGGLGQVPFALPPGQDALHVGHAPCERLWPTRSFSLLNTISPTRQQQQPQRQRRESLIRWRPPVR